MKFRNFACGLADKCVPTACYKIGWPTPPPPNQWVPENWSTHPLSRAQKLMTHRTPTLLRPPHPLHVSFNQSFHLVILLNFLLILYWAGSVSKQVDIENDLYTVEKCYKMKSYIFSSGNTSLCLQISALLSTEAAEPAKLPYFNNSSSHINQHGGPWRPLEISVLEQTWYRLMI